MKKRIKSICFVTSEGLPLFLLGFQRRKNWYYFADYEFPKFSLLFYQRLSCPHLLMKVRILLKDETITKLTSEIVKKTVIRLTD